LRGRFAGARLGLAVATHGSRIDMQIICWMHANMHNELQSAVVISKGLYFVGKNFII
jgi:hypothetical protein